MIKRIRIQSTAHKKYCTLRTEERKLKGRNFIRYVKPTEIAGNHIKCVVVGDSSVGKTSLLISYINNSFSIDYVPTIMDNYTASVLHDNRHISLGLWDTADSEEDYERLRPLSYPESNVFLICFSLVDPTSLHNIRTKWVPEVKEHMPDVPFVLCGCKVDLREDPLRELRERDEVPVSIEQGFDMAVKVKAAAYFETSGMRECFQGAVAVAFGDYLVEDLKEKKKGKGGCGIM